MKFLAWEIRRRPRPVRLMDRPEELSEKELTLAFSRVGSRHPLYQAILQLIETAIVNARHHESQSIANHAEMAGYFGGAQHLQMLRDDMESRRLDAAAAVHSRRIVEETKI